MTEITGRCLCRALTYSAAPPVLWAGHCHCEDCQRAAGADYISWLALERGAVTWTGARQVHTSSPGVERSFCPACGTPMSYEAERWPNETHLYAPTLDDRSHYAPTRHFYWKERVPWFDGMPHRRQGTE